MTHLTPEELELAAKGTSFPLLEGCPDCRTQVRQVKGRQALLAAVTPYTLSDVAFRRVEARLMEQVEAGAVSPSPWRWVGWLVPLTAVLLAGVWLWESPRAERITFTPPQTVALRAAPFAPLTVLEASADARVRRDGQWGPLALGAVLPEGTEVAGTKLVLASAGTVFELDGEAALGGVATVALGAGSLSFETRGHAVDVLAGTRRVVASESRCFIARSAAEVVLDVDEGAVQLTDSSSAERLDLKAKTRRRWGDGSTLLQSVAMTLMGVKLPAVGQGPWARLDVKDLPVGAKVELDGLPVGEAPLSRMVEQGRHRVVALVGNQPPREAWVDLVGGSALETHFTTVLAERTVESPPPDADALGRVMEDLRRQRPRLASCYEKWLKANPAAGGRVDLVLSVSARGRVVKASVKGDPISASSAECLTRTARQLVLSPLGSEQDLEVPLVLTPGGK
jgi:hypothetical protein